MPSLTGGMFNGTINNLSSTPRRRLGDLVTPQDDNGRPDPNGSFVNSGASTIYREQGNRLIAVKFDVRRPRSGAAPSREARENGRTCSKRPIAPNGAANSKKCKKPRLGCSSPSLCRSC